MRQSTFSPTSRAAKCMYTVALDTGVKTATPTLSNVLASPRRSFPESVFTDSSNFSSPPSTPKLNRCSVSFQTTKPHCCRPNYTILPSSPCTPQPGCTNISYSGQSRVMSDANANTCTHAPKRRMGIPKYCSYDSLFVNSDYYANKTDVTESNTISSKDPMKKHIAPQSVSEYFLEKKTNPDLFQVVSAELSRTASIEFNPSTSTQDMNEASVSLNHSYAKESSR